MALSTQKQRIDILERKEFWIALIALVTMLAYFPMLFNLLTNWDDRMYVNENPFIQTLSWANIKGMFSTPFMGNYHPLAMLSLSIDYQVNKFNPFVFHLTNMLLHTANAILVFLVIRVLTGKFEIAAIAGLLFGVHPFHVESVAWVSERKDVLYACFYLLSLYSYIRYLPKKEKKWFFWSLGFFLLSLLSKGQAVTLALSLFLVDYFKGRKIFNQSVLLEKIPFLLLAVIFGIIAIKAQQGVEATDMVQFEPVLRIPFASYGLLMYIAKLIFPFNLSVYYPYPVPSGSTEIPLLYWLCIIPAFCLIVLLFISYKRSRPLFFALGFFLVNIFLLLQLLPVGGAIMSDRYVYIPSIGYCFLIGFVISDHKWIRPTRIAWSIAAVYILLLGIMTFARTSVWKNNFTLWTDVIEKYENVPIAWYNRANAKSDTANYKGAIEDYNEAIRVSPLYFNAYINRANAKTKINDNVGAVEDLNFVISHDSTLVNAYINRAMARRSLLDFKGSLDDYRIALKIKPRQPELYISRGNVLFDIKDSEGAIKDFTKAMELNPKMITAYTNRAFVKKAMNDLTGAIRDYDKAIAIDPDNSELYNNRGNIKFQLGQNMDAIADYEKGLKVNPKNFLTYKNLGAIHYIIKDYHAALTDLSSAIKFNPSLAELYYTRALIKKELRDIPGATADYASAVKLDAAFGAEGYSKSLGLKPVLVQAPYEQFNKEAYALDMAGKLAEAVALYNKAVSAKPDYAEAWLNLGNAYGKMGRFADAITAFNSALAAKRDYAEAIASRGIAFASLGKINEALTDLGSAIRMKPGYAMAYFNRALLYLNTGKKDLACVDLSKAVQLGYSQAYAIYQKECGKK